MLFVALFIQHAMGMRRVVMSPMICPTLPYFHALSHKRHDFRKNVTEHKIVFGFSLKCLSESFLATRRNDRDMTKNVYWSSYYQPIIPSRL